MTNMWQNTKTNKFSSFNKTHKRGQVENTNSGEIDKSYNPSNKNNKSKKSVRYGNVRLTVNVISRINAYQKLNGLRNRSEALNKILNKAMPSLLTKRMQSRAKFLEDMFKRYYKGRSF